MSRVGVLVEVVLYFFEMRDAACKGHAVAKIRLGPIGIAWTRV